MSYSLLAHLYPRIKGSQEDIATYSLVYILEQSPVLNEAFSKMISEKMQIEGGKVLSYHSQEAKEDTGRPDIAGYKNGALHILCEAKFYAGLTLNQPVSYIQRLQEERGKGLIFICPQTRMLPLWGKLCEECQNSGLTGSEVKKDCVDFMESA